MQTLVGHRGALLALVMVVVGACSFGMRGVRGDRSADSSPRCSVDRWAPVVDTLVAVPLVILGVAGIARDDSGPCGPTDVACPSSGGTGLALIGGAYALAASDGFRKAAACRRAVREHRAWLVAGREQ